MAKILCKTKGNADPKGKPRVYFTCHPADFDRYFERVCTDIFKTHDCAIFYTEDMTQPIPEQDRATDLESNNLFVVPVTFQLLSRPNRAMDADIPFAMEKHIPILPIMMESGLDQVYARPDKFGELQYLDPNSRDATEVSYGEKLKKYLESVLISEEMADRIRAAFDAYIFLSYRKKDRRYANELMRMIHRNQAYRDIAIWYDEFLTPGESFRASIRNALEKSKLFALLVTPNLLEEPEGKPNFVMGQEYPAACSTGIGILPAEMEATDRNALAEKYPGIPDCVDAYDDAAFQERLVNAIEKVAIADNDREPEHLFLMGLAYLDGIDVETDRSRGLELITAAAERDLPEAMRKLYRMYDEGSNIQVDYSRASYWAERLAQYYQDNYGEEHPETLAALSDLALSYRVLGEYQKSLKLNQKVYALRCDILGEKHPDTLISLNNLAIAYGDMGAYEEELELIRKAYTLRCAILGEENPDTLRTLGNLAQTYRDYGEYTQALELSQEVYELYCKHQGEEHPNTLLALSNLSVAYGDSGNHQKELELQNKVYALRCKVLGEEHPDTLLALSNLAVTYRDVGSYYQAKELAQQVYALRNKVLGAEHPDTILSMSNLAVVYGDLDNHDRELELQKTVYTLRCKVLGEEHPDTLLALSNLTVTYLDVGECKEALVLGEKVYSLRCKVLGEEHPDTMISMSNLAVIYGNLGRRFKEAELEEKLYALRCEVLGETHPHTLLALNNLAVTYQEMSMYPKAYELMKKAYEMRSAVLGEKHPDTRSSLNSLELICAAGQLCLYCGGPMVGFFRVRCSLCGKRRFY